MEFGIQFFPDVSPEQKSAKQYFEEALHLIGLCDFLGYTSVRTVEHYFHPYGGYSPNPIVFLTAASQRTQKARLVTGAVLPAFNNPLKLAGEIGMLDAISGGRLEVGFARAFLPHEFRVAACLSGSTGCHCVGRHRYKSPAHGRWTEQGISRSGGRDPGPARGYSSAGDFHDW